MITPLLALSLASNAALAGDNSHWWGIGPLVGTMGFPLEYPIIFPEIAKNGDGDALVQAVTGDLRIGGHGVYYIGDGKRLGTRLHLGTNFGGWFSQEITAEYELILTKEDKFQLVAGGGLGFGHERFGTDGTGKNPDAYLDVTYFPVRAQIGALWRDKTRAYEAQIFGVWHLAGDQRFSQTGDAADEETGTAISDPFSDSGAKSDAALYAALGIEATVYFGNFKNKGGGNDNKGDGDGKKKDKDKGKKNKD